MKKHILTTLFFISTTVGFSQNSFDKFEDNDEVFSVIVSEKMFDLMSKVKVDKNDKEMQQYLELLKKLNNLKVFTTKNSSVSTQMKTAVDSYLVANPLEELMRLNTNGKNISINVKPIENSPLVKEFLMFIQSDNKDVSTVIMSLKGEFNLEELSILIDRMNLPGKEELEKVSKQK
jgi:hypothetical protein